VRAHSAASRRDAVPSSREAIYAALIGNLLVAAAKAVAAAFTGSSAMLSEAIHSLVDTGNEGLLLYGQHRATRRPDAEHQFGYGRELYFWSFIVALLVFALGAGVSIYEGIMHIRDPELIQNPAVNYIVLGLAFLFEGASWLVSVKQFRIAQGKLDAYAAFRQSKDPASFTVLFEDSAALLGIAIAALGTWLTVRFQNPLYDGMASICIGLVLGGVALLLARESKSLLIGEPANREFTDSVLRVTSQVRGVASANGMLTSQLAPDQIIVFLSVEFEDSLRVPQIEERVREIEASVRSMHPEVVGLFIKPQTHETYLKAARARFGE
jgi:cation diffusion facilitator family transporter